jgi:UDP-N-acetylmuramyl-tripeptide synthetase
VFVAVVGASVDGHDLVGDLAHAAAVVVERDVAAPYGVTVVRVADTKLALAQLAAARFGHPSRSVRVVGITGTNGKTTVSTLVEGALLHLGRSVARIGTTGNAVNGVPRPSAFTTPEAPALQALLAELRDASVETLVMEVSSIGLAQHRVDGIVFHAAAFTNLTQDHLNFHGDMGAYAGAKARLFQELLRPAGRSPRALLFGDDPSWKEMGAPPDHWVYGQQAASDLQFGEATFDANGIRMKLRTPQGDVTLRSPMIGRHNAQNLVCAVGLLLMLDIPLERAAKAVGAVDGVSGRLEVVPDPIGGRLVVVDYAHTPDALEHALRTVREVCAGTLWVVFGCGGDRDVGKRAKMGAVAAGLADRVVVTSDNPRSEPPRQIVDQIVSGIDRSKGVSVEPDRGRAIAYAVGSAVPGDAVLIAGKGHETTQEIGGRKMPFDDRVHAASEIAD